MRYASSITYLNSFLNLERIITLPNNRLWNFARMRFLLDWFKHPEKSFFPVLIAGTKGKGSTGFFLESILGESRIPVGFYSSPHLEDSRERIRIGGRMVSEAVWARGVSEVKRVLAKHSLAKQFGDFTYFEIMTVLAILLFKEAGVRIGIFEIGMGGRLDATNVLDAKLAILTPIHLDHEAFLGNTIGKIAREKAAIIRRGADIVVSPQTKEAEKEIVRTLTKRQARFWPVSPLKNFRLGLAGDFQKANAGAAVQAARLLRNRGYSIPDSAIKKGLMTRGWPGRLELFTGRPDVLLDGAHNPASMTALVRNLKKLYPGKNRLLIFGTSRDKKSDRMLKILNEFFSRIILTPTPNPRSQEIGTLLMQARGVFDQIFPAGSIEEALCLARKLAGQSGLVVITGSFYLIGEARRHLKRRYHA